MGYVPGLPRPGRGVARPASLPPRPSRPTRRSRRREPGTPSMPCQSTRLPPRCSGPGGSRVVRLAKTRYQRPTRQRRPPTTEGGRPSVRGQLDRTTYRPISAGLRFVVTLRTSGWANASTRFSIDMSRSCRGGIAGDGARVGPCPAGTTAWSCADRGPHDVVCGRSREGRLDHEHALKLARTTHSRLEEAHALEGIGRWATAEGPTARSYRSGRR
jgi:hypothetical protein